MRRKQISILTQIARVSKINDILFAVTHLKHPRSNRERNLSIQVDKVRNSFKQEQLLLVSEAIKDLIMATKNHQKKLTMPIKKLKSSSIIMVWVVVKTYQAQRELYHKSNAAPVRIN